MRKFNSEKWERMQHRKEDLHQVYRLKSDNFDHERENYSRASSIFFNQYNNCEIVKHTILHDAKTLSAAEMEERIHYLVNDWPIAAEELNVTEGFNGKHSLVDLYKQMRVKQKAYEEMQKAANNQQNFISCFNTLDDFAAKFGKGDQTKLSVVTDPAHSGY